MPAPANNKTQFSNWLEGLGRGPSTIKKYVSALEGSLSKWALEANICADNILTIQDPEIFGSVSRAIRQLPTFGERDATGHGMYGAALERYAEFLIATPLDAPERLPSEHQIRKQFSDEVEKALTASARERARCA